MSPLTALVMDQVEKIKRQGQTVAIIQAKCSEAGKETGIEAQGDYMENAVVRTCWYRVCSSGRTYQ